ncbi:MAG: NFACT family protein, partial [Treponema sp.]|nr:NFACT family protein [Treponema sp.]
MSLNWKEIDLVLEELNLPGMQIQKIYQSTFDVLALIVYGKQPISGNRESSGSHLLVISLLPLACRFHECFRAVPKSNKPLRFAEFLKSRLLNGRIEEAAQLGEDRIIRIVVKKGESIYRLYIRLWSNAANVILTDEEGIILDAMRRLPKRGETGGAYYKPEERTPRPDQVKTKQYEVRDLPGDGSFNSRIDNWYAEHGGARSL